MAFTSDSVQVFLAALDHGSFSAAARALSRVPSAVSMTIAHLEAELAVQLFDRSGRTPRLLPRGIALARDLLLVEQSGVRAHFAQLTSARAVEMIAAQGGEPDFLHYLRHVFQVNGA